MNDVINRQVAIETVNKMYEVCDTGDLIDLRDLILESLAVIPSEQLEIIHCEDCKYCDICCDNKGNEHYSCKINYDEDGFWNEVMNNDFCSIAERRTHE